MIRVENFKIISDIFAPPADKLVVEIYVSANTHKVPVNTTPVSVWGDLHNPDQASGGLSHISSHQRGCRT